MFLLRIIAHLDKVKALQCNVAPQKADNVIKINNPPSRRVQKTDAA
ncbi:hypothetical protein PULV_a3543 [Pseudoalteromonas ulvae UL12]|nr:hypothetical protein [Pseudoalteromonas ulvae UL12]